MIYRYLQLSEISSITQNSHQSVNENDMTLSDKELRFENYNKGTLLS